MNFLTLAWFGQNSVAKFLKTLLFTLLYIIPGAVPLGVYMAAKDINDSHLMISGNTAGIALIVILFFPSLTLAFGLFRQLHRQYKRNWMILITIKNVIEWKKFLVGAAVWGSVIAIFTIIDVVLYPEDYIFSFQPIPFFSLLFGALIAIPIQASTEELLFRGYITQQIALIGRYVWVPLAISSGLFALAHSFNPEVGAYGFLLAMSNYVTMGLVFGIATLMDDGLELAMGIHTGNNLIACLLVTDKNSALQTPAIFTNIHPSFTWIGSVSYVAQGILFLFILSRIYKWDSWSTLWSRIIPPAKSEVEPPLPPNIFPEQA
jgi:uncharacterized protein